jgi:hypothetical protein
MKTLSLIIILIITNTVMSQTLPIEKFSNYPQTEISNDKVAMKLFLPDPEKGLYRATRFDWSGIISSLKYKDHEYFGYWKSTHDPNFHEDLTGPVESYIKPGLGFGEERSGEKFIRIGVGILQSDGDQPYETFKTYKILDHGEWVVEEGKDWISFQHTVESDFGYAYIYTKRIDLKADQPGFTISHILENTGRRTIETDQYNHNFFMIDGEKSGPALSFAFPYEISTENDLRDMMEINDNVLRFSRDLDEGESIWMELKGYSYHLKDHVIEVQNKKSGAGVRISMDEPVYRMVFWACHTTYCPENFIFISAEPGQTRTWVSDYTLFTR